MFSSKMKAAREITIEKSTVFNNANSELQTIENHIKKTKV